MSWVVGVGKKSFPKKIKIKELNSKSCKIHETKIYACTPGVLFLFPAVSKAE